METQLRQGFTGAPQWATTVNSSFRGLTVTGCIYSRDTEQSLHIQFLLLARTFHANRGEENLSTVTKYKQINSWDKTNISSYLEMYSLSVSLNCHCGRASCLLADKQSLSYSSPNCHSKPMSWQTSDLEASELSANSHSWIHVQNATSVEQSAPFREPVHTVKAPFAGPTPLITTVRSSARDKQPAAKQQHVVQVMCALRFLNLAPSAFPPRPSPLNYLVAGDLLQRPGSSVPTVVILRLHDSDDLGCPLLVRRRVVTH